MPEDRRLMPTPATEHTYKCIWVSRSQLPLKAQEPVAVPWKRNDLLVNFPLLEERGYSLSFSIKAPQPDFSRGIETYIPSPQGEHTTETDAFLRTDQLNRISPRRSALPSPVDQESPPECPFYLTGLVTKRLASIGFDAMNTFRFSAIIFTQTTIFIRTHILYRSIAR